MSATTTDFAPVNPLTDEDESEGTSRRPTIVYSLASNPPRKLVRKKAVKSRTFALAQSKDLDGGLEVRDNSG